MRSAMKHVFHLPSVFFGLWVFDTFCSFINQSILDVFSVINRPNLFISFYCYSCFSWFLLGLLFTQTSCLMAYYKSSNLTLLECKILSFQVILSRIGERGCYAAWNMLC
ncbi:hypothetical protein SAY87_018637 [Trapa incisa]|uniref:Uncharacterized protein n=1 Tax=Trapa incisa TaxID=236973 RepID=A0AAN7Q0L1_9MYRT|nr:hypothetical protein SAY87_018637 [Trapa incisa]